ncbi:hypothetical protein HK414_01125 [Ramlibacter terrae]|uniref:CoA transferase n=1 Tax=Ramlibacter terrae TaxID=2732511 RepID=A0ABX6P1E3_9BURK|nr:hypothetical protein HK414_01125 [Ramlibacter terrae]
MLDLSQGLAGPYCGMLLAQHGADVIKLEPPEGDWSRGIGTRHGSHSAIDFMANRGKRSVVIDMKKPGGVAAVLRMAAQCDVVIEGFRPGVSARRASATNRCARRTRAWSISPSAASGRPARMRRCRRPTR